MARKKKGSQGALETAASPETVTVSKQISEQLTRMLTAKLGQSQLLRHSLEKGLGNEQSLRDLLSDFLPRRYGIAKGKIANPDGLMSRHLDVIIYDAISCPSLFMDEHRNQILPIEGVFAVIEVKTTLSSNALRDSFENLRSVFVLGPRADRSTNDFVTSCPPYLHVFAFQAARPLSTIAEQYIRLNKKASVGASCFSFSSKSPGFPRFTGDHYLVCSVDVLNKGSVHHLLDGKIRIDDYGEYTLGMFLFELLARFDDIRMPEINPRQYLNWINVASWRGPGSLLAQRRLAVGCAYKAFSGLHKDSQASGSWHDDGDIAVLLESTIAGSKREYKIVFPHGLSAREMERSAFAQIREADAEAQRRLGG